MSLKKLEQFAELANETKGAAFTLTKTKAKMWTIYFPALWDRKAEVGIKFVSRSLDRTIELASIYLMDNRTPIKEQILRYEI